MPTVLFLGRLARHLPDPGTLFMLARLAASISVLGALAWVLLSAAPARTAGLAAVLTLSQGTFVAHALEFRYDWAILVAWLAAFGLIVRQARRDFF